MRRGRGREIFLGIKEKNFFIKIRVPENFENVFVLALRRKESWPHMVDYARFTAVRKTRNSRVCALNGRKVG